MTQLQPRCLRPLLIISALAIATTVIAAPMLTGKVIKIADGDTLTLLVDKTQIKVRLEGIDTPERAQPFGRKAGQALAAPPSGGVILRRLQVPSRQAHRCPSHSHRGTSGPTFVEAASSEG